MTLGDPLDPGPPEEDECEACLGEELVEIISLAGARPFYQDERGRRRRWPHGRLYVPCPTCCPPEKEKQTQ